jgi:hypothetical protein
MADSENSEGKLHKGELYITLVSKTSRDHSIHRSGIRNYFIRSGFAKISHFLLSSTSVNDFSLMIAGLSSSVQNCELLELNGVSELLDRASEGNESEEMEVT